MAMGKTVSVFHKKRHSSQKNAKIGHGYTYASQDFGYYEKLRHSF